MKKIKCSNTETKKIPTHSK